MTKTSSMFSSLCNVFGEAQRVLERLDTVAHKKGLPREGPGDLENFLCQALQGWRQQETTALELELANSLLMTLRPINNRQKKDCEEVERTKAILTEEKSKLLEKLTTSNHEAKRARNKMKSFVLDLATRAKEFFGGEFESDKGEANFGYDQDLTKEVNEDFDCAYGNKVFGHTIY
ncbi:hypothetical protein R1sor_018321 [Riccia sorocarpa]|uniref:Uncharacterized protein n=1 Tax=Riccia sorocarpa TaxID=122646 RepID=A0ABD3IB17_9MARC